MGQNLIKVKVDQLRPGMGVQQITGLSSEYSYLDSKRIGALKEHLPGAKAIAVRGEKTGKIGVESLAPGDQVTTIFDIPADLGMESINPATAAFLKEQGFLEFLVTPSDQAEPEAAPQEPPPQAAPVKAPAAPPAFVSMGGMEHKKRVAETRYFLELVEQADTQRYHSTSVVEELFLQGRADKHSTQPAMEAVENILRNDLSTAMVAVTGLKASDQTYSHCVDMAVIFNEAAQGIIKATGKPVNEAVNRSTLAAGFMHDIGKSKVPKEILDSKERFEPDSKEMELLRSHVEHSAQILSDAGMDKAMINVAHFHHVKLDSSLSNSYPKVAYAELMPLTRLACIVDVYQALTGNRSFKKNWVPAKAVEYLRGLQDKEFDKLMMGNFLKVMGLYPVGSLVRLSTGDLAFVTKTEGQELERPTVVLMENALGEPLSSNPLLDLQAEPEISITDIVDHYEHFGGTPEGAYQAFKSLKVI